MGATVSKIQTIIMSPIFFRKVPIYVQVYTDRMIVVRLDTGKRLDFKSKKPYSNSRIVVAHFGEAEDHLKLIMRELFEWKRFTPNIKIAIQQMERAEGGLSSVEQRALADLASNAGATLVKVVDQDEPLSNSEANALLQTG